MDQGGRSGGKERWASAPILKVEPRGSCDVLDVQCERRGTIGNPRVWPEQLEERMPLLRPYSGWEEV